AARARWATTCAGSSPTCRPRFSVSYGAAETPPCRVVTATSTPSPGADQRTSGGSGGSGTPPDPTERTTARRRWRCGLRGLVLVPHGGGDHREERSAPWGGDSLQLGEAVELGRVRAPVVGTAGRAHRFGGAQDARQRLPRSE